jgi:hypothetical protein
VEVYRCPSRPSESSVELLVPTRCRLGTSSRNWLLVQSPEFSEVPRLLVSRSHCAVGHFLGCVIFLRRTALITLSDQCTLSSSFACLQSIAQHDLARRPQPASTSHGLLVPSAHQGSEVHSPRASPDPLRSACRVWLPSWRLTPSEPVPVLFHTGGALGICPSELSPLGRFQPRFRDRWTHVPLNPSVIPSPRRWAGPTGRGFWALTLPGVPGSRRMISVATAGCSLGLLPLRAFRPRPDPGFRLDSSHALCGVSLATRRAGASEFRSAPAWPHPPHSASRAADGTTLAGFRHRKAPERASETSPGLCVHLLPRRPLLTVHQQSLDDLASLYRSRSGDF